MTVPAFPVPNPAAPSRPATVTISSALIFLVVAMQLLSAGLIIAVSGTITEAYQDAVELETTQPVADVGSIIRITYLVMAVVYVLIAIGMTTLALLNNRGKNASRILTWVFGGLGLCCNSINLSLTAAGGLAFSGGQGVNQGQVEERVAEAIPGWFNVITTTSTALTVIGLLGAIVLLALPPSNEWFRRPAQWNGAMPFLPYPGQPGYPQQPGQAGPFAQPAYPPAPSHLGSPQQYGQPGDPAPGLPSSSPAAPMQPNPWAPQPSPSSPEPPSDPWAVQPAAAPTPSPGAAEPPSSPPGSADPSSSSPGAAEPPGGGDQGGDPPQRPASDPS